MHSRSYLYLIIHIDEAQGEKAKESIRTKAMQYMERAYKLRNHIEKMKREAMVISASRGKV